MTTALTDALLPTAAALACAVADGDDPQVQDLLGDLDRPTLTALARVLAAHVDPDKPFTRNLNGNAPPVAVAVRRAADRFGVPEHLIFSTSRRQTVVDARAVACYAAHRLAGMSSPAVGRYINRDHSTVLYACSRVAADDRLRDIAEDLIPGLPPNRQDLAS